MDVAPLAKRIILTGGRSRLAGVIRQHFNGLGAQLVSLSRSEGDTHLGLENLFVNNLVDQADTLLHMAWSTVPISSERHVGLEWREDIPLLLKVLETICASPNRERLHFIFFSSGGAVYGNAKDGKPSVETDECEPIGWYGQAKLAAERLIVEYGRRHGLVYTILRISNPYGFAVPAHKPQGIIPFILKSALDRTPLSIWGDGSARKDFLHHTDFVTALEGVIRTRASGVYNLSSGESHTVREVIALAEEVLGRKVALRHVPAHEWDVHDSLLNSSKIQSTIPWSPKVNFAEGIRRAASTHEPVRS